MKHPAVHTSPILLTVHSFRHHPLNKSYLFRRASGTDPSRRITASGVAVVCGRKYLLCGLGLSLCLVSLSVSPSLCLSVSLSPLPPPSLSVSVSLSLSLSLSPSHSLSPRSSRYNFQTVDFPFLHQRSEVLLLWWGLLVCCCPQIVSGSTLIAPDRPV